MRAGGTTPTSPSTSTGASGSAASPSSVPAAWPWCWSTHTCWTPEGLPHPLLKLVGAASLALFATDAAITVTGMAGLRQKMDYLREESLLRLASLREGLPALTTPDMDELIRGRIRAYVEGAAARVHATTRQLSPLPSLREAARWPSLPSLDELARTFAGMLSDQERRVLRAFPQARLSDYRRLLEEVRERLTR